MRSRSPFSLFAFLVFFVANLPADPTTKQLEVDFGRDVASRNLKGLATQSDGRILPGPVFTDLNGPRIGDILWVIKPAGPNKFVVGTGPDGKVQEVAFNPKDNSYTVREVADVGETQAIAVQPLPDGSLLVGTSPTGAIYLVKDGKAVTRIPLPADSVFDFLPLADGTVLAATGNPGKIYQLDLKKLAKAGLIEGKAGDDKLLADKGVTLFGEIRDRNVRRLARIADGRVIAGSSPKGNIYAFSGAGAAPVILQENREGEVVDLLPIKEGGFYAALVFTSSDTTRIGKTEPKADNKDKPADDKPGFVGRSSVVRFPADGYPETIVTKTNVALYRLAQRDQSLLLTAGEQGDAFGYSIAARRSLTFAGSASSQLNDIVPLNGDSYLLLRNNAPGIALMTFSASSVRELETKRLDLGQPAEIGAFHFARLRGVELAGVKLEIRTNFGSDEVEGWTPWTEMKVRDGALYAEGLRGRYVKLRLKVAKAEPAFQLDKGTLHSLPQNRRPALADFRIFSPNLGLIPASDQPPGGSTTLGQMLAKDDGDKRKASILNSQVVPQPGTQIVYWAVNDADGDNLRYTFSIRAENADTWSDLAVNTEGSYVQFETGGLAEGLYFTRLAVSEQAPRPVAQRLSYAFETDNLLVDHTPPVLGDVTVVRDEGRMVVALTGRDTLSLLEGAEFIFNNGVRSTVTHPADGVLDGHEEKFVAEISEAQAAGATSVEVILYDQSGNAASARKALK